jgi:hypothetical protein
MLLEELFEEELYEGERCWGYRHRFPKSHCSFRVQAISSWQVSCHLPTIRFDLNPLSHFALVLSLYQGVGLPQPLSH